jgi:hypothetical protein
MIRMQKKTKLTSQDAIDKAIAFFGPKGYGLKVNEQSPTCAKFEGAGGNVEVTTCEDGKQTSVEIISTEWEIQSKEFMSKLH